VIGESIAMDAEATSQLFKSGVNTTDDSHKFIWHKVWLVILLKTEMLYLLVIHAG
jgi:hypothetical protein